MADEPAEVCRWCGGADHADTTCPRVKAFEFSFDINGQERVSRVEFLTPRDCAVPREKEPEPEEDYPRRGPSGT